MAKVVNLSTFRKQKARADRRSAGDASAAQHGLSKAQMALARARKHKSDKDLDGHAVGPEAGSETSSGDT